MEINEENDSNLSNSEWQTKKQKKRKSTFTNSKSDQSYKKKKGSLKDLPTLEELNELRDAESMFHSSIFRMQMEELMKELKSKMDGKEQLVQWLLKFSRFLCSISESETYSVNDLSWLSNRVQFPIASSPEETKGVFKFVPPTGVKEIGSFPQNTMCATESVVDLSIETPKAFWQKMDFVNHRYHRKRALYLTYIAQCLLGSNLVQNMKFSYSQGCYLKPLLLIKPKGELGKQLIISLTVYPEKTTFKITRFVPERNNVRQSWYFGTENDSDPPTPHYNASILADVLLPELNDYLKESISSQNVADGIILLKVWCIQRDLISNRRKLTGFFISMFVSYLLKKQKINPMMSSYQIFRCSLLALQNEDLLQKGVSLSEKSQINQPTIEKFHEMYDVVLVDPSGFLNISFNISKETFLMLQHEAKLGIEILNSAPPNSFDLLFMTKITFCQKFEHTLHLSGPKKFKRYIKKLKLEGKMLDYGEDIISCITPRICEILRKGLQSRILLLDVKVSMCHQWQVSKEPRNPNKGQVTIGILLNPEVPPNNLEKGPSAEDPEAKVFRSFWGNKSEMRRFQDGSIREAVFWPANTVEDKRNVFCSMVKYILERHANVKLEASYISGTELDSLLEMPEALLPLNSPPYGCGEEVHVDIAHSFTALTKQLRSLDGLPLLIASIQGTSPAFRFSETFPPLPMLYDKITGVSRAEENALKLMPGTSKAPPYVHALTAIINFEGSGKWPDDADVIKRVKAAFYIKISSLIQSQHNLTAFPFPTHVDIVKDGFVFRFEIASHKEVSLLKQVTLPNGAIRIRDTKESQELERTTQLLPKLNSFLHGLHQQHNTYGTACRLAKRWLSSQLLHGYLHSVTIELIMAFVYVNPSPYTCPSLPQLAFVRFLSLLHTYDWKNSPLIINFNDELKKSDLEEINSSFASQRSTYPPMSIIISLDRQGAMWTRKTPQNVILRRLVALAKASAETLEKQLCNPKILEIKEIFRPPLDPYDVIIQLRDALNPLRCLAVDYKDVLPQKLEPYKRQRDERYPIVEYNPVELYLKQLQENFGELALFFHDGYGGDFIAVAFKPAALASNTFTVSHANSCCVKDVGDDGKITVVPNICSIITDFRTLGLGLVKGVDILNKELNFS